MNKTPVLPEAKGRPSASWRCVDSPCGPHQAAVPVTSRISSWFSYVGSMPHPCLQEPALLEPLSPSFKRNSVKDPSPQVPLKQSPPYRRNRDMLPQHLQEGYSQLIVSTSTEIAKMIAFMQNILWVKVWGRRRWEMHSPLQARSFLFVCF